MANSSKKVNVSQARRKLNEKTKSNSTFCKCFRIFDADYSWDDKDEVLDAVYWYRQALAFIMGIIWGILGLTGTTGVISFVALNSLVAYAIANKTGYEFEPEDNYLSVKEGFMATFATFLVTWIVTYTSVHFSNL